jgi:hypothetical protein
MSKKLNLSNDDFEADVNVICFQKINHKKAIKVQSHSKTDVRQARARKTQSRYAA